MIEALFVLELWSGVRLSLSPVARAAGPRGGVSSLSSPFCGTLRAYGFVSTLTDNGFSQAHWLHLPLERWRP